MGQLREAQVLLEATQLVTSPVGCDPGATGSVPCKLLPTLLLPMGDALLPGTPGSAQSRQAMWRSPGPGSQHTSSF